MKYPNFLDIPHAQSRCVSGFGVISNMSFASLPSQEVFVSLSLASTCVGLEQTLNNESLYNESFREIRRFLSLPKYINVIGKYFKITTINDFRCAIPSCPAFLITTIGIFIEIRQDPSKFSCVWSMTCSIGYI